MPHSTPLEENQITTSCDNTVQSLRMPLYRWCHDKHTFRPKDIHDNYLQVSSLLRASFYQTGQVSFLLRASIYQTGQARVGAEGAALVNQDE